ncbi:MAG: ACP S-malonyltransferase, partial [Desulfuromonadaceae bacterium]|nr:ACP S-malonyltransferase [Desulfuromonadaceae bacterium]
MPKTAFIFPGQGSQYPGMGKDLVETYTVARQLFEEADDALGFKLSELCFSGTDADLKLTANTQPAILTASIAVLKVVEQETGLKADFVAGHSLGEYSALVCSGALSFTDAVRTVRARGTFMQEAVPVGVGTMAA